jgi:hypothetical protein
MQVLEPRGNPRPLLPPPAGEAECAAPPDPQGSLLTAAGGATERVTLYQRGGGWSA